MQGLYLIHHHPFMLFIGVLLGMLSSFSFLGPPKMVSVPSVLKDAVTVPVQDNQHSRKGAIIRETLYIAVITSSSLKNAQFVHDTWGQDASFIEYYVGNRTTLTDLPVVHLPNDRPLLFELLLYLHQEYNDDFNWFLIANENMYVRVQKLNKLLNQLDPTTDMYLGLPGQISWYKQAFFYELFCKISTGIILSRELLRKIVPHFEHCLHSTWLDESPDILLGKCIAQHISIQCSSSKEVSKYIIDYFKIFLDKSVFL